VVDFITYVGLDVHKDGIAVALAESGIRGEVREYGRIANTAAAINRLLRKLGDAGRLRFCYEAVPSGYGIQRHLLAHGHECVVVGPSLISKTCGRSDQDRSARCRQPGKAASGWRADGSVGSRCRARGDARPGTCTS
jgi:transposase